MTPSEFYSPRNQFLREWRVLWRAFGTDVLLGGVYVLIGFYSMRTLGGSQVYDVVFPFIIAAGIAAYLTYGIRKSEMNGNTAPFYFNLPRTRMRAWDAQMAFLVTAVIWLEVVIVVGTYLKLGGAGITPIYRLYPLAFCVPFAGVGFALVFLEINHSKMFLFAYSAVLLFCVVFFIMWLITGAWGTAHEDNNYLPERNYNTSAHITFTVGVLVTLGLVIFSNRSRWRDRELGEIQ